MTQRVAQVIERATSDILFAPDLDINLQIVESLNSEPSLGPVLCEELSKRLSLENHTILTLCFELIEMILKNCPNMYKHIGSKKIMSAIYKLALSHPNYNIQEKALDFIQFYGNLFQFKSNLQFYPTLVTLRTKHVKFPQPRDDPWKPDGYKKPSNPKTDDLSMNEAITTDNLYYKINQLKTSKELLDEIIRNMTYDEDNPVIIELYPQCKELHNNFVLFIQESGHKCQDKVLEQLLALNDSLNESLKKYQTFKNDPSLLKKRDEERAKNRKPEKRLKKKDNPETQPPLKKENPLIGNLLSFESVPETTKASQEPSLIGDLIDLKLDTSSIQPAHIFNIPDITPVIPPVETTLSQSFTLPEATKPTLLIPTSNSYVTPLSTIPTSTPGNIDLSFFTKTEVEFPTSGPPVTPSSVPVLSSDILPKPTPLLPSNIDMIFGTPPTTNNNTEEEDPFAALATRKRPTTTLGNPFSNLNMREGQQ